MEQGSRKGESGKFRFAVSVSTINKPKRFLLNFMAVFLCLISLVIKLTVVRGLLLTRVCLYVGFTVDRDSGLVSVLFYFSYDEDLAQSDLLTQDAKSKIGLGLYSTLRGRDQGRKTTWK